jgi:hypothetical protein
VLPPLDGLGLLTATDSARMIVSLPAVVTKSLLVAVPTLVLADDYNISPRTIIGGKMSRECW